MFKSLVTVELTILSSLLVKDRYGLEIIKTIKEDAGKTISIGGLYTTLNRLEKKGYVKGYNGKTTSDRGGNRRKYFKLTGLGSRALKDVQTTLTSLWGKAAYAK